MNLKELIVKYADLPVFNLPNNLKEICKKESLQDRYNTENSPITFATVLITNPLPHDWPVFIRWANSLRSSGIFHIGVCLECPDPILYPHSRCKCKKCRSANINVPLFERFWFARKPHVTTSLTDLPSSLDSRFIIEDGIPIVKVRRYDPISFLCFSYDLNGISEIRPQLNEWFKNIRLAGFEVKETCISSYDPCDKSVDCECYDCREFYGCRRYKVWISKPVDIENENRELERITRLPVLEEIRRIAGARPGGLLYEQALKSFNERKMRVNEAHF